MPGKIRDVFLFLSGSLAGVLVYGLAAEGPKPPNRASSDRKVESPPAEAPLPGDAAAIRPASPPSGLPGHENETKEPLEGGSSHLDLDALLAGEEYTSARNSTAWSRVRSWMAKVWERVGGLGKDQVQRLVAERLRFEEQHDERQRELGTCLDRPDELWSSVQARVQEIAKRRDHARLQLRQSLIEILTVEEYRRFTEHASAEQAGGDDSTAPGPGC